MTKQHPFSIRWRTIAAATVMSGVLATALPAMAQPSPGSCASYQQWAFVENDRTRVDPHGQYVAVAEEGTPVWLQEGGGEVLRRLPFGTWLRPHNLGYGGSSLAQAVKVEISAVNQGAAQLGDREGWVDADRLLCALTPLRNVGNNIEQRAFMLTSPSLKRGDKQTVTAYPASSGSDCTSPLDGRNRCKQLGAFELYFIMDRRNGRVLLSERHTLDNTHELVGWVDETRIIPWSSSLAFRPAETIRVRSAAGAEEEGVVCGFLTREEAERHVLNGSLSGCNPILGGPAWYARRDRLAFLEQVPVRGDQRNRSLAKVALTATARTATVLSDGRVAGGDEGTVLIRKAGGQPPAPQVAGAANAAVPPRPVNEFLLRVNSGQAVRKAIQDLGGSSEDVALLLAGIDDRRCEEPGAQCDQDPSAATGILYVPWTDDLVPELWMREQDCERWDQLLDHFGQVLRSSEMRMALINALVNTVQEQFKVQLKDTGEPLTTAFGQRVLGLPANLSTPLMRYSIDDLLNPGIVPYCELEHLARWANSVRAMHRIVAQRTLTPEYKVEPLPEKVCQLSERGKLVPHIPVRPQGMPLSRDGKGGYAHEWTGSFFYWMPLRFMP